MFINLSGDKEITKLQKKVWLASPTMHGEEKKWINEAIDTNWVTTIGENINEIERLACAKIGRKHAVALGSGTAALHLAIRLAAVKLYGKPATGHGALEGKRVFCSDMTFAATVEGIVYENGMPVFIDTEYDSWNMDPDSLKKAFELYPDVRLIVLAHLYGTPSRIEEIVKIAREHDAVIIEDAAESFGASVGDIQTGCFGDYSVISFNGNKIITGSSGGMFLCDSSEDAKLIRKWSTQSREDAPWYQHEDLGYNYRMSNIVAGVIRGHLPYLDTHIALKREIYYRYKDGLNGLPVNMNPVPSGCTPNYWLSCLIIDREAMCRTSRDNSRAAYIPENGKSCPSEILETLQKFNADGRPIWKPMHLQPLYGSMDFVSVKEDAGADIFERGVCLPSDIKMTSQEQDVIIEIIRRCFE